MVVNQKTDIAADRAAKLFVNHTRGAHEIHLVIVWMAIQIKVAIMELIDDTDEEFTRSWQSFLQLSEEEVFAAFGLPYVRRYVFAVYDHTRIESAAHLKVVTTNFII